MELRRELKRRLFAPESGLWVLKEMNLSAASRVCLEVTLQVLWKAAEARERLASEISLVGEPLKNQAELLISITGVTPLIVLAFLADVADIRRFGTLRKMNAYLGLVPRACNSGGKDRPGHVTRESRKLTRTILTQCVHHVAASSMSLDQNYQELRQQRASSSRSFAVSGSAGSADAVQPYHLAAARERRAGRRRAPLEGSVDGLAVWARRHGVP